MTRDKSIDLLRSLGLILVILVHCSAPWSLSQIRSFDVPLMVFVSALTFKPIGINQYFTYLWKRTKRLVVPAWLFAAFFLLFLFALQLVVHAFSGKDLDVFRPNMLVPTFLLWNQGGIGYLWIIRVFLLVMVISPFLHMFTKFDKKWILLTIIVALLCTDGLYYILQTCPMNSVLHFVLDEYVIYLIGYGAVFLCGLELAQRSIKNSKALFVLLWVMLVCLIVTMVIREGLPICFSDYKYPPRFYFLTYGIIVSALLWLPREYYSKLNNLSLLQFMGQNSMWIYLWHIFVLYIVSIFPLPWFIKWPVVTSVSAFIVWIQSKLADAFAGQFSKYLKG